MDLPPSTRMAHDFAAAMSLALIVVDARGDIQFANPASCSMFGYEADQVQGRPITIIIPERMRGAHTVGMANVAAGAKPGLGGKAVEVSALRSDGSEFPIEITLSTWKTETGFWAGAAIKDISERRERDARLMRLASHDTLTGLQNRHEFMTSLGQMLASGRSCTLLLMDLDGFKEVNDTHGHMVGDSLLQAVGVRLPYLMGERTIIGRLGGDEFGVILPDNANPLVAQKQAADILDAFRKPFALGGLELELGTSIGIAIAPLHGSEAEELLASADFALYRAKAAGGRAYRFFEASMRNESQAKRDMRDSLRRALLGGELDLYYQPQVELANRHVVGFEALIRWNHPTLGSVSPGEFIPIAEDVGLIGAIGSWVLRQACKQATEWPDDVRIAVNLSSHQFLSPGLLPLVETTLKQYNLPAHRLELEVTESLLMETTIGVEETLASLSRLGLRIALDDFGTGFSSLSYLRHYRFDKLKIDQSFISDLETNSDSRAIVQSVITLARELRMSVAAEGVETKGQFDLLQQMSCGEIQGFLVGRPMPSDQFEDYLRKSRASVQRLYA